MREGEVIVIKLMVNGAVHQLDVEPDAPLLWVLRDELGLKGTKFGCGIASCGACTVHVDGMATRSCVVPVSAVVGKNIITIEGLTDTTPTAVQTAWITNQVPQCGYCQSGMIMAVSAFLKENPNPSQDELDAAVSNICRCGTYVRIRKAVAELATSAEG
jgi:isoquinoline 1-oxidoreductase alpha subunit